MSPSTAFSLLRVPSLAPVSIFGAPHTRLACAAISRRPSFVSSIRLSTQTFHTTRVASLRSGHRQVRRSQREGPGIALVAQSQRRTMASNTDAEAAAVANEVGVTEQSLADKLRAELEATHVIVQDISGGCGQSFEAVIVSPKFEKKMTLARHRMVNAALRQEIAAIHAWTPKCFTPEEWDKRNKA